MSISFLLKKQIHLNTTYYLWLVSLILVLLVSSSAFASTSGETGVNDFRISNMGPNGDINYGADLSAMAYNSANDEFLVVWVGRGDGLAFYETEIYGQRINASTGAEVGVNDFRISDIGPDSDPNFGVSNPAIVYNPTRNEYLVIWQGDDTTDDEFEIYGQLLDTEGNQLGLNDFRVSDMGPEENIDYVAYDPDVAFDPITNEYLVVWGGCDTTCSDAANSYVYEIWGQRIDANSGSEIGENDFQISNVSSNGDDGYYALNPSIAYNDQQDEFMIVWSGATAESGSQYSDIFGQRLNSAGLEIGFNDFQISDVGNPLQTYSPQIAYNHLRNEYLVIWGGAISIGFNNWENEIFGQLLNGSGADIGANDFRISHIGPDENNQYSTYGGDVAYSFRTNEYFVVWDGSITDNALASVHEIYGEVLNGSTGETVGADDVRLSDMGPENDLNYTANFPSVSYGIHNNNFLISWSGDDDIAPLVVFEFEIFGQFYVSDTPLPQLDEITFLPVVRK